MAIASASHAPGARILGVGDGIEVALLAAGAYSGCDPKSTRTLGIALDRQRGVHAIGSDIRVDFDTLAGTLAATPAGVDVFSESPSGGEYLAVRWRPADPPCAASALPRRREWVGHARALELGLQMRRHFLVDVVDLGALHELTLQFIALDTARAAAAPLSRARYARALDRIEQDFCGRVTLQELAADAGQTPVTFLRGFAAIAGQTPHRCLTARRVAQARRLMAESGLSLAAIAYDCGFAHQSHLGVAFRQVLGITPGAYRRWLGTSTTAAST